MNLQEHFNAAKARATEFAHNLQEAWDTSPVVAKSREVIDDLWDKTQAFWQDANAWGKTQIDAADEVITNSHLLETSRNAIVNLGHMAQDSATSAVDAVTSWPDQSRHHLHSPNKPIPVRRFFVPSLWSAHPEAWEKYPNFQRLASAIELFSVVSLVTGNIPAAVNIYLLGKGLSLAGQFAARHHLFSTPATA